LRSALAQRVPEQEAVADVFYGNRAPIQDDLLGAIETVDDALALFEQEGIDSLDDYGAGFQVVDKDTLVNVPMVLIQWVFRYGREFGSAMVVGFGVTKNNERVIFTDGSETGIRRQLEDVTKARVARNHPNPQAGLVIKRGVKRDEFPRYMRDPQTNEFLIDEEGNRIPVLNPDNSPAIGHVYRFA